MPSEKTAMNSVAAPEIVAEVEIARRNATARASDARRKDASE